MKHKVIDRLKVALMVPLAVTYAVGGCTANVLRDTADVLDNAAHDIDGEERDVDLGDWLADELDDI